MQFKLNKWFLGHFNAALGDLNENFQYDRPKKISNIVSYN